MILMRPETKYEISNKLSSCKAIKMKKNINKLKKNAPMGVNKFRILFLPVATLYIISTTLFLNFMILI